MSHRLLWAGGYIVPRIHKYRAQKTAVLGAGSAFPSRLEAAVYAHFALLQKAELIQNLERYPSVLLKPACKECKAKAIRYKVDMCYQDKQGVTRYVEAKGAECRTWLRNKRLWKDYGPGPLEVWKGDWKRPRLVEIIEPAVVKPLPGGNRHG